MTCIMAIDPGLTGAIAFLFTDAPDRISVYDMPVVDGAVNPHGLRSQIQRIGPSHAFIELVGPMPRDGSKQAFRFGGAYFSARVVVAMLDIPTTFVTPQTWKKHYRLGGGPEAKEAARARAIQLFPASAEHFQLVKHHNRAEAALLARYGAIESAAMETRRGVAEPGGGDVAVVGLTPKSSPRAPGVPA